MGRRETNRHETIAFAGICSGFSGGLQGGILGYGAKNRLYKGDFFGFSEDLPVTIGVIDTEEKIRRALPALREMISEGIVAMTDLDVLHQASGEAKK